MDVTYVNENKLEIYLALEGGYVIDPTTITVIDDNSTFNSQYSSGTIIFRDNKMVIQFNDYLDYLPSGVLEVDLKTQVGHIYDNIEPELYQVNTVVEWTDIYSEPNAKSEIVDTITGTDVYTIVAVCYDDEYNWWGKLKSGVGWINLSDPGIEPLDLY